MSGRPCPSPTNFSSSASSSSSSVPAAAASSSSALNRPHSLPTLSSSSSSSLGDHPLLPLASSPSFPSAAAGSASSPRIVSVVQGEFRYRYQVLPDGKTKLLKKDKRDSHAFSGEGHKISSPGNHPSPSAVSARDISSSPSSSSASSSSSVSPSSSPAAAPDSDVLDMTD